MLAYTYGYFMGKNNFRELLSAFLPTGLFFLIKKLNVGIGNFNQPRGDAPFIFFLNKCVFFFFC